MQPTKLCAICGNFPACVNMIRMVAQVASTKRTASNWSQMIPGCAPYWTYLLLFRSKYAPPGACMPQTHAFFKLCIISQIAHKFTGCIDEACSWQLESNDPGKCTVLRLFAIIQDKVRSSRSLNAPDASVFQQWACAYQIAHKFTCCIDKARCWQLDSIDPGMCAWQKIFCYYASQIP